MEGYDMSDTQRCEPGEGLREWVILKGAYYYRSDFCGYTSNLQDAGRYTKAEAEREAAVEPWHMKAIHAPAKPIIPVTPPAVVAALVELVRSAYAEGWQDGRPDDPYDTATDAWDRSAARAALATYYPANPDSTPGYAECAACGNRTALVEALEGVLPAAESYWDAGPEGEGWQSHELSEACEKARAALALYRRQA